MTETHPFEAMVGIEEEGGVEGAGEALSVPEEGSKEARLVESL
jgi:hypothetical protein